MLQKFPSYSTQMLLYCTQRQLQQLSIFCASFVRICGGIIWKNSATVALEKVLNLYQEKVLQSIFSKHDFKDKVGHFKKGFSPQF